VPGAHVHVDDCAAFVEHGNLRYRGAYADAYAEQPSPFAFWKALPSMPPLSVCW